MPLSPVQKIDLVSTDPTLAVSIRGGPEPADEWLHLRLAQDYQKYKEMRRDPHIRSRLDKRVDLVLGRNLLIEAPKKRGGSKGVEVATKLSESVRYEALTKALLKSGMLIGFSVVQIDPEEKDGLIIPNWKYVPQNRFTFAFHKPEDTTIKTVNDDKLDPETDIVLVQGYELRLLTKRSPFEGERIPKDRFVVYTFDSEESPWGLGLGYSIYPWWTVKREATKAWLMHSDRYGSPPTIGTHPDLDERTTEVRQLLTQFEGFLKSVSPSNWGRFPEGFEAKVMEAIGSAGPDVHQGLIAEADNQISKVVLGEVPFSDKSTGSYAANASQVEDRHSSLTDSDCNLLDEQLYDGFWLPTLRLNGVTDKFPSIRRESYADQRSAALEQQKVEFSKAIADRDKTLQELGYRRTAESVLEIHGEGLEPIQEDPEKPPLIATIGLGGTQAMLSLLGQVSSGSLPRDNAIAALTSMFGLDKKTAGAIVPEPKQEPQQASPLDQLFGGDTQPAPEQTPQPPQSFEEEESSPEFEDAVAVLRQMDGVDSLDWDDPVEFEAAIAVLNHVAEFGVEEVELIYE